MARVEFFIDALAIYRYFLVAASCHQIATYKYNKGLRGIKLKTYVPSNINTYSPFIFSLVSF